jgi:hypothetical protein
MEHIANFNSKEIFTSLLIEITHQKGPDFHGEKLRFVGRLAVRIS